MNRKIIQGMMCGIVLSGFITIQSFANEQVFATANVNIRTDPWIEAEVISYLPIDGVAEIIYKDENDWCHIISGDCEGWVSSVYLTEVEPYVYTVAVVNAKALNIRGEIGSDDIIDVLTEGQEIEVVDDLGSHAKVVTDDGDYGYIDASYVEYKKYYKTAVDMSYEDSQKIEEQEKADFYWSLVQDATTYSDNDYLDQDNYDYSYDEAYDEEYSDENYDFAYNEYNQTVEYAYNEGSEDYVDESGYDEEYDDYSNDYVDYTPTEVYEDYSDDSYDDYTEDDYSEDYTDETTYDSGYSSSLGVEIANEASVHVGGIYTYGGSEYSTGVDCSHFVYNVLRDTGAYSGGYMTTDGWLYSGVGTEVSIDQAQVGDIVVYNGHMGIIGYNGLLIEAKGSAYGITYDRAWNNGAVQKVIRM